MHDFNKMFQLRVCFTVFMSARLSNAVTVGLTNPNNIYAYSAKIDTLFVKEPNGNDFTRHSPRGQMHLGLHRDRFTLSFFESNADNTFLTFRQRHVDFKIFHSKSMAFSVRMEGGRDVWHFRCVFSDNQEMLDILYSYLSVCTGQGLMMFKMEIVKVERYERTGHMGDPIIQTVEDLQPALLYDQLLSRDDPFNKIFSITPSTSMRTVHKVSRLVFRTGTFRIARENHTVVLELSDFSNCLYIFYFHDGLLAETFLGFIKGWNDNVALDITPDVLSYLRYRPPPPPVVPQNEVQSHSSSESDDERRAQLTMQLADWGGKHSRSDDEATRNVRGRSRG